MPNIIHITDLSDPALAPFVSTNEIQLKRWNEPSPEGLFIAESPKVIRRALAAGYTPTALLCEQKYLDGQAADIIAACESAPVYTAPSETLTELTGFKLTQGVLCAMQRKPLAPADTLLENASRIVVLEDIMNQTNIGAIFRNAAALGFDALLLTPAASDPLYRRSIRVSMGTVFQIPWTYLHAQPPQYVTYLQSKGFAAVAMALRSDTLSVDDCRLAQYDKLAVILGTEGEGLNAQTIANCDHTVKIPMSHGVDSLNVASASAIALWELNKRK
ncbi:MAG: RNA methyltransferase [Ruminococcus sp.]|nr:RNA methyltransferase [Ruminococcus sp.]